MTHQRLKIMVLASWYPNRVEPHNGDFVHRFVHLLSQRFDVAVLNVTTDPTQQQAIEVTSTVDQQITTIHVYQKKAKGLLASLRNLLLFFWAHIKGYRKLVQDFGKPNLTHVQIIWRSGWFARYLNIFHHIPYLITEHWTGYMKANATYQGFSKKVNAKIAVRKARTIVAVSNALQRAMQNHQLRGNYQIIPNFLELPREPKTLSHELPKKIIHVSSQRDIHKNVSGIIKTIATIDQTYPSWELHLIGRGDDTDDLIKLSKELGLLDRNIFFHGQLTNEATIAYVKKSDFFVMFSHYETFSIATAEAIACGIPVIATKCGGPEDFVSSANGILIEPGNVNQLREAMIELLQKHHQYDPQILWQEAQERFSAEKILDQYTEVYQMCLKP